MYIKILGLFLTLTFMVACSEDGSEKDEKDTTNQEQSYESPTESDRANTGPNGRNNQNPPVQMQQGQNQGGNVDISEKEFNLLIEIVNKMGKLRDQSQQEMMQSVQKIGMTPQKFTQIQQSMQDPNKESQATDEEMKKFNQAMTKIQQIQKESTEKMKKVLDDANMTTEEYRQKMMAIQQNPEMQQKLMQSQMQNAQRQPQ